MWNCSACSRPIQDCKEGYLIADEDLLNWRIVHRLTCDPHVGPWHSLEFFVGKRGARLFRSLERGGAFSKLSPSEIEALRGLVVCEAYDQQQVHHIPFRRWLRAQEKRDDPVGDLAQDMARDSKQQRPNPSLNELYHHLRIQGASREALRTLIEAYREWQSCGNTYRETRTKSRPAPKHRLIRVPRQRDGWLKLRFTVLKRDGYRCQICGRTTQDGIKLEIDHKVARSKGGSDDPSNLWTLCFDCNRGKGNANL